MSTPENKSYLSAGITAFSPWTSRSNTPKPPASPREPPDTASDAAMGLNRGGDHTISRKHRLSLKNYPRDCPPLAVQWYHAIDIPKRKPLPSSAPPSSEAPLKPKKWAQFSQGDSRAIEAAFQKLADEVDSADQMTLKGLDIPGNPQPRPKEQQRSSDKPAKTKVPVNEDFLFDVDVESRELAPAYWLGPVYDVRRGTWFYENTGKPCDENLATQLEEGYLKIRPWRFPQSEKRSVSQPRSRPSSLRVGAGEDYRKALSQSRSNPITPKSSSENLKVDSPEDPRDDNIPPHDQMKAHRLFGVHMNSVVTYQNANTAWLLTDDFLSQMSSTLYQRFAGGGHFAGVKLTRGTSSTKTQSTKDDDRPGTSGSTSSNDASEATANGKPEVKVDTDISDAEDADRVESPSEARTKSLVRQMSSLVSSSQAQDPAKQEEEIRKRDEKEIRDDYQDQSGEEQGRDIEHLLLVTHGIGQRLGMRLESVNFVHDVNTLRKSLKGVYANSTDLQALNAEVDKLPKNCRIQVLPICWRHLLDFPKQSLKHNRKEHDLGDLDFDDQDYPNLEDITIEGVPTVRNLITDLALDILLYQSPAYKGHISRIVLQECNRIYRLFCERNPSFDGKVSLVGHSLGSAILFDILCHQKDDLPQPPKNHKSRRATDDAMKLDFPVEDFYALGSPLGLFQMLKGRTIAARQAATSHIPAETPGEGFDDPFAAENKSFEITTSRPKCAQLFNIFHPTDPISYRIEPLISPAMSALKPQPLPYTKKGIFGAPVGQGLTGIGARVGQSVSGLWSSLSSGIASSLINRSLGITGEDALKLNQQAAAQAQQPQQAQPPLNPRPLSIGAAAGTNAIAAGVIPTSAKDPDPAFIAEEKTRRLGEEPIGKGEDGEHPPTLIDSEIETLFSGFHKRTRSQGSEGRGAGVDEEWRELEEKSRRLRREEAKVRALNGNGRVDYNIQEGAFDINIYQSIASHLTYWADEDVGHFIISQLLARQRVFKGENEEVRERE